VRCWLVPLLVGGFAACSLLAPDNSPQAQCERQANDDPAVVAIYTHTEGGYTYSSLDRSRLAFARRQAILRCMRAKGLAPPGGVQPVEPH
jgi:hypothetical protein